MAKYVTLEDKDAIEEARVAYDALSNEAKELVTNFYGLENREAAIAELEEATAEVANVSELNDALDNSDIKNITLTADINSAGTLNVVKEGLTIDGEEEFAINGDVINLSADDVTLQNLAKSDIRINVDQNAQNVKVLNNTLNVKEQTTIKFNIGTSGAASENTILNTEMGIFAQTAGEVYITNNTITIAVEGESKDVHFRVKLVDGNDNHTNYDNYIREGNILEYPE